MTTQTRQIGLSLGADICWPACYEELIKRLQLSLPSGADPSSERVEFAVERVRPEPFDLRAKPKYDLVIDRVTHWFYTTREWVKKIAIMDGVYVLNNPWMIQAAEKHTTYCAMMRLGFPIPETWLLPPKEYPDEADFPVTVRRYNKLFDLNKVAEQVGYPMFMKPYDGGAWRGVSKIDDAAALHKGYDASGKQIMHLQNAVDPFDLFVRGIGIGPQVNVVKYDPAAPLHGRYVVDFDFVNDKELETLQRYTRVINAFFCWDYNSCESLRKGGIFHPIDFANACPDSQVTSLHYHFPWMVKAMVKWSLFAAYTKRKPRLNPNWEPYFAIADLDLPFDEKLLRYDALAKDYFDADRFEEFCGTHLAHLDEVAYDFFGTPRAKEIVREKVSALYPKHEIDPFTEHFYGLLQFWRKTEADRAPVLKSGRAS
ncbi:MAG: hypothetical protein Q8P41_31265 [Pseudomonadota bacterium]|nr:hypothetical protein [Pseudomonadota bacterium]